jgi:hypothetical protein
MHAPPTAPATSHAVFVPRRTAIKVAQSKADVPRVARISFRTILAIAGRNGHSQAIAAVAAATRLPNARLAETTDRTTMINSNTP